MIGRLKKWVGRILRDLGALFVAIRDARTPLLAKVIAGLSLAYALSPIDLIPDFLPLIGWLDDMLLVPIGISLAVRLIPATLMVAFRADAPRLSALPRSKIGAVVVIVSWILITVLLWWLFRDAVNDVFNFRS